MFTLTEIEASDCDEFDRQYRAREETDGGEIGYGVTSTQYSDTPSNAKKN